MGQSKQAIKRRIRSVQSTMKIHNAMELVATSKLQKQKGRMEKNKEYADFLYETMAKIMSVYEGEDTIYLQQRDFDKPLYIVFTSDTGLCGGYNSNMFRYVQEIVNETDPVIMVGLKGVNWISKRNYNCVHTEIAFDNATPVDTDLLANKAMEYYRNGEVSRICILYTEFVTSVSFEPKTMQLLPMTKPEGKAYKEILFEPSPKEILNELIPMYVCNMTYSTFMRAKTAEQASRRMAMENATDNAQELTDNLLLQYNQARQAAITQEITEIVAGADAL